MASALDLLLSRQAAAAGEQKQYKPETPENAAQILEQAGLED